MLKAMACIVLRPEVQQQWQMEASQVEPLRSMVDGTAKGGMSRTQYSAD